jgi:2-oxoglutarate dehydrogenase E2 component (dihydrolipoamide succinyltransferase)
VISSLLALGQEGAAPAAAATAAAEAPADDLSRWMGSVPAAAATPAPGRGPVAAPTPAPRAPEFHPAPAMATADSVLALATPSGWSEESTDLAGSFVVYARLSRERRDVTPSVDRFISGIAVVAPPAPKPEPAPAPEPVAPTPMPAPVAPAAPTTVPAADGVVDIKSLCYSGPAALARALEVRRELQDVLAGRGGAMRPILDELLDLIELAAHPGA